MEANRKRVFRILGSLVIVGVAGAALFGLTGVLADPSVPLAQPEATQVAKAQLAAQLKPDPTPAAKAPPELKGAEQTGAGADEKEPFPQFDEEPSGS